MKAFKWLSIVAACAMAGSGTALAQEKQTTSPADLFPGQDILPIMSWISMPPGEEFSLERLLEMKDAGINVNFSHTWDYEWALRELDLGKEAGIRIMFMCDKLREQPEETVKAVMNHPALAGYFLKDEPMDDSFDKLWAWAKRILDTDPNHVCYLNLLPTYGPFPTLEDYRKHVRHFVEAVPIPLISFDHYPVIGENTLRADWYGNLEVISEESRRVNRPFWAFALSTSHWSYPPPTMASLRLQMYSNLAYGAQGLQYFTYWNPTEKEYHDAPITLAGKRSSAYDRIRDMNRELQARAFVFVRSRVIAVNHLGEKIPDGTKRLEQLPPKVTKLETQNKGAIVSQLEKEGRRYLVIVNRSLTEEMHLTITFEPGVTRILKDGTKVPADKYTDTLWLTPGECEIFEL